MRSFRQIVSFVPREDWIVVGWVMATTGITGSWILSASVSFFRSMPRYAPTMFPIFILFALLGRNCFCAGVLTVWSLLLFALSAVLFARGEWAF